jgi:hypothetical protein
MKWLTVFKISVHDSLKKQLALGDLRFHGCGGGDDYYDDDDDLDLGLAPCRLTSEKHSHSMLA